MLSWDRTPSCRCDGHDGDVDVAMSCDNTSSHDDIPSYRYDDIPSYPHNIPSWDRTPSHQYDGCDGAVDVGMSCDIPSYRYDGNHHFHNTPLWYIGLTALWKIEK